MKGTAGVPTRCKPIGGGMVWRKAKRSAVELSNTSFVAAIKVAAIASGLSRTMAVTFSQIRVCSAEVWSLMAPPTSRFAGAVMISARLFVFSSSSFDTS